MKLLRPFVAWSFVAALGAQAYDTPLFALGAAHPYTPVVLYSVDGAGGVTVRHTFSRLARVPNAFAHHHDNRTLALHETNPDGVVIFDPATGGILRALHLGPPFGNIDAVRPHDSGGYLVASWVVAPTPGAFVHLVTDQSVQPLFSQANWDAQIRALTQDLETGDVLAGVLSFGQRKAPSLIRISAASGTYTTLDPTPRYVTAIVQDHRDGSIVYGAYNEGIFRRAPDGAIETLIPVNNPWHITGNALAFDRGPERGILLASAGARIARIAFEPGSQAKVVAVHDAGATLGLLSVKDLGFEHERNVIPRRTGTSQWEFGLHFPREAGRSYALMLSLTGFTPGLPIGDRRLPLVLDEVLIASLDGRLQPYLQGNLGTLDQDGRAAARLDLSTLGPLPPGTRLWLAAVTLDASAPHGVHTISKPVIVLLD